MIWQKDKIMDVVQKLILIRSKSLIITVYEIAILAGGGNMIMAEYVGQECCFL